MDERKKIDLQQHISPKAPRRYLVKILIYCGLLGGLIALIYFLQDSNKTTQGKHQDVPKNLDSVEVRGVTIED